MIALGVAIGAAVACLALLVWLEARRRDRRRLAGRLAASGVAVASLAALAVEPSRSVTRSAVTAIIITDGADDDVLRAARASAPASRLIRLADTIPDAGALRRRLPAVNRVVVAGWGLDAGDLERLDGLRIEHAAAPLPRGVTALDQPAAVDLGATVTITGSVRGESGWVRLEDAAGVADSARPDSAGGFRLRHRPRAAGLARYVVRSGGAAESLSVEVVARRAPAVLVLESAPGFETSRLRDWLARRGSEVAIRTTISRGRTRVEQVNRSGVLGAVSPELLERFDLVVADGRALAALGRAERRALERGVRETRLGLLLRADEALIGAVRARGEGLAPFWFTPVGADVRTTPIRWAGDGGASKTALPIAPFAMRERFAIRTVARDASGRPVAQWAPVGTGRVGASLVGTPSRWLLQGDEAAYDGYWAMVVGELARPRPGWSIETLPAFVDHPQVIARRGGHADHAVIEQPDGTRDTVYLAAAADSTQWTGTWRPRFAGYHRILGGDTAEFDVRGSSEWQALRAARRSEATAAVALASAATEGDTVSARQVRESIPISPVPFFLLFVVATAWLWWERRAPAATPFDVPAPRPRKGIEAPAEM